MMKLLFFLMLCLNSAHAALPSGAVWEVRSGATAGNVNGGFFNPANPQVGSDLSQSDGPSYTFTNLASTVGTTNPCVVTSASHNFTSTDNGNAIHITSGSNWTLGWYEIVSTSGNAATLDRACGTNATLSSGTFAVGGALSLGVTSANTGRSDVNFMAAVVSGNTVYIKNGSYALGSGANYVWGAGTASLPVTVIGYNGSRTDNPTGSNRPTLTAPNLTFTFGAAYIVRNLILVNSTANGIQSGGTNSNFQNIKFYNNVAATNTNRNAFTPANGDVLVGCELVSPWGYGLTTSGLFALYGCYIHDSSVGVRSTGSGNNMYMFDNVFQTNNTHFTNTISTAQIVVMNGNTFYGNEAQYGTGISMNGGGSFRFLNNIFYGLTTAVSNSALAAGMNDYNAYNNNGTNRTNFPVEDHVWTTAPGFKNVTNITGTAGSISGSTLTDGSKNFSSVIDNQDFVTIVSGTGVTQTGSFLITGHTSTTLTLTAAPGGSGSDLVYFIVLGKNFLTNQNYVNKGVPASFGGLTTNYRTLGAVQKMPGAPKKPGGK